MNNTPQPNSILFIDDKPAEIGHFLSRFERNGWQGKIINDVGKAESHLAEVAKLVPFPYRAVVFDMRMPGKDDRQFAGVTLLAQFINDFHNILYNHYHPLIPVIILSGVAVENINQHIQEALDRIVLWTWIPEIRAYGLWDEKYPVLFRLKDTTAKDFYNDIMKYLDSIARSSH